MRQSNLLLSIVLLLLPIVSISAQSLVLRQAESDAASEQKTILLEKFTGEWCGNCPTSEPKIHDFMTKAEAEGYKVSLIEYHYNDFLQQDSRIESLINNFNVEAYPRSEEHTSELQSRQYLVCRLLLEKKKQQYRLLT